MVQHNCIVLPFYNIRSEFLLGYYSHEDAIFGLSQPINGLLADRLNRKSLMFWSNIMQIGLALSFILVDGPEDMWWLITISGIMMLLHGVYVTAERAAVPNIVAEDDLITANAIGCILVYSTVPRGNARRSCSQRMGDGCSIHH